MPLRSYVYANRAAACGAVSQYNESAPAGPRNLPGMVVVKRLRMEGFIVFDFADHDAAASKELAELVATGTLVVVEDIVQGPENAPQALIGLPKGENRGKRMVRVSPDPV
jgi:NADPH-dependent curcumin reductase CurA